MKSELIILIGNIGSGKTTLCKELVKQGHVIVSRDDLRYSIGAGEYTFNLEFEPIIAESIYNLVRSFMKRDISLVVDETNMNKKMRSKYLHLAQIYNYKATAIILKKLSMNYSVKRRLKNNHGNTPKEIWEGVWKRFNDMYEKPSKKEGFKKIIQLS